MTPAPTPVSPAPTMTPLPSTPPTPVPSPVPTGLVGAAAAAPVIYGLVVATTGGGVWSLGLASDGRLGDGADTGDTVGEPTRLDGLSGVVYVDSGSIQGITLSGSGSVYYWPSAPDSGIDTKAEQDSLSCTATEVSAGGGSGGAQSFWCAITVCTDGTNNVECWGDGGDYKLGQGSSSTDHWSTPVAVDGLPTGNYTELSCGYFGSCVVVDGTSAWCWGWNNQYSLGDGTTNNGVVVEVQGLSEAVVNTVEVGYLTACASVGSTGKVECWGSNHYGQIGDGTETVRSAPVANGVVGATQIEMTNSHACALTSADEVYCWGRNTYGQLGDGTTTSSSTTNAPVKVTEVAEQYSIASISVSYPGSTYVTTKDGALLAFGRNDHGQLGDNTTTDSTIAIFAFGHEGTFLPSPLPSPAPSPVPTSVDNSVIQVVGTGTSVYDARQAGLTIVTANGGTWVVGTSNRGSLGTGEANTYGTDRHSATKFQRLAVDGVVETDSSHGSSSIVKTRDGSVYYWPRWTNDDTYDSANPVYDIGEMSGFSSGSGKVRKIAAGGGDADGRGVWCVLTDDEYAPPECWGDAGYNVLGQEVSGSSMSDDDDSWDVPLVVKGLPPGRYTGLQMSSSTACVIINGTDDGGGGGEGEIWCWGSFGTHPVGCGGCAGTRVNKIPGISRNFTQFKMGSDHSCVVEGTNADGTYGNVICMGENGRGQLGDGTTTYGWDPVKTVAGYQVADGSNSLTKNSSFFQSAEQITVSHRDTCVLTSDKEIWCWGWNHYCQHGVYGGSGTYGAYLPQRATILDDTTYEAETIYSGMDFTTYVRTADGSILAWGRGNSGQFGNNRTDNTECAAGRVGAPAVVGEAAGFGFGTSQPTTTPTSAPSISFQPTNVPTTPAPTALPTLLPTISLKPTPSSPAPTISPFPTNVPTSSAPTALPTPSPTTFVAAAAVSGLADALAVLTDQGGVFSAGHGADGRLGDGADMDAATTTPVRANVNNVVQLDTMFESGIVLTGAYSVHYWPEDAASGAYGIADQEGLTCTATEVSAGGYSAEEAFWCAIISCTGDADNYVECWGDNEGYKLGDGSETDSWSTPVQVAGMPGGTYTELSCGTHSSCVVVDGDSVWCWGSNDNGALGDGTDTARTVPVEVQGLRFVAG
mmetsp:Transcript_46229/g.128998  ORF Transcript_46229/g.128998 Transcript_46229/m.128998 type:complete len:1148 (-) Transcript_46229:1409-4852(-)